MSDRTTPAEIEAHYVPLIAAARAAGEQRRDEAWLAVPGEIAGVPVRALALADYLALLASGNAHVTTVEPPADPVDALRFWAAHNFALLWLLSADYRPDPAARDAFVARHANRLSVVAVHGDIDHLLHTTFADRPRVSTAAGDAPPAAIPASFAAHWIHDFATAYGWAPAVTLALPLAQIFQLRQILRHEAHAAAGKPLVAADEADVLAARAFAEIAALA